MSFQKKNLRAKQHTINLMCEVISKLDIKDSIHTPACTA